MTTTEDLKRELGTLLGQFQQRVTKKVRDRIGELRNLLDAIEKREQNGN